MNSKKEFGGICSSSVYFQICIKRSSFIIFQFCATWGFVVKAAGCCGVDCAWVRSRAPLVFKAAASVTELLPSWFFPDWSQLVLHDGSQQSVKLLRRKCLYWFSASNSFSFPNTFGIHTVSWTIFLTVLVWVRGRVCLLFANFWSSHKIAKIIVTIIENSNKVFLYAKKSIIWKRGNWRL